MIIENLQIYYVQSEQTYTAVVNFKNGDMFQYNKIQSEIANLFIQYHQVLDHQRFFDEYIQHKYEFSAIKAHRRIHLIFDDWKDIPNNKSVYSTELGVNLSMGQLHSGTIFEGLIQLEEDQVADIEEGMKHNIKPVFYVELL